MNNKKRVTFSIASLLTGVLVYASYSYYTTKILDKEECRSSLIVFYNQSRSDIQLNFIYSLEDKKGIVAVSGNYYENDKLKGKIRRDIEYSWRENHDIYQLISTKVNKYRILETLPSDTMAKILPDFYVFPDKSVNYSIQNQGAGGFIFSTGGEATFLLCKINAGIHISLDKMCIPATINILVENFLYQQKVVNFFSTQPFARPTAIIIYSLWR